LGQEVEMVGSKAVVWLARIVAGLWAGWWTFFGVASGLGERMTPAGVFLHAALPGLVFMLLAAFAWRWEAAGGSALFATGLFVAAVYRRCFPAQPPPVYHFILITMALPPALAGLLFVANRWARR
jgi:hypothetical protein